MGYIPDNYDMFDRHDAEQQRQLARLPLCVNCGNHIQTEECYEINDELICPDCIKEFKRWTCDYYE